MLPGPTQPATPSQPPEGSVLGSGAPGWASSGSFYKPCWPPQMLSSLPAYTVSDLELSPAKVGGRGLWCGGRAGLKGG